MRHQVIEEMKICEVQKEISMNYMRYTVGGINIILALSASIGNMLIIISILRSRRLRLAAPIFFIISLASADWLVGAVVQPLYAIILFDWSPNTCVLEPYKLLFGFFTCPVSICSAMLVCLDRMLKICKPYKYEIFITNKRSLISILLIWISGAVIGYCNAFRSEHKLMAFGTLIWVFTALAVGIYCSIKIYEVGVIQIKEISRNSIGESMTQGKKRIIRERKLATSLIMVLAAILFCWLPFVIVNVCIQYTYTLQNWKIFYLVRTCTITFGYANSTMNIFIFSFKNREIKKAIKNLLGIKKINIDDHLSLTKTPSTMTMMSQLGVSTSLRQGSNLQSEYGSTRLNTDTCYAKEKNTMANINTVTSSDDQNTKSD